jgi:hypothetical protein
MIAKTAAANTAKTESATLGLTRWDPFAQSEFLIF